MSHIIVFWVLSCTDFFLTKGYGSKIMGLWKWTCNMAHFTVPSDDTLIFIQRNPTGLKNGPYISEKLRRASTKPTRFFTINSVPTNHQGRSNQSGAEVGWVYPTNHLLRRPSNVAKPRLKGPLSWMILFPRDREWTSKNVYIWCSVALSPPTPPADGSWFLVFLP